MKISYLVLQIIFVYIFQEVDAVLHDGTSTGEDISGSQIVYPGDLQENKNFSVNEIGNNAQSIQGIANAGGRLIFGSGTTVKDNSVTSNNKLTQNTAVSQQNKAISGQQLVLDNVLNSTGNHVTYSSSNEASVIGFGSGNDFSSISGAQLLVQSIDSSTLLVNGTTKNNTSTNKHNGKAVSGVDQAFGDVTDVYISQQNKAEDNLAIAGDGVAISGIQTGARNVTDSTIKNVGLANQNNANSVDGNAVAGIQNSFGILGTTFPGSRSTVILDSESTNNIATVTNGEAIAGVSTNIEQMNGSMIIQDAIAYDNKAVTFGEGDVPKHSIAGVNIVINDAQQSTVALNLSSSGNHAFNYHYDPNNSSDAIAGSQVVIGSTDDSIIAILANSSDNFAYAKYGEAVAGNKINIIKFKKVIRQNSTKKVKKQR
eukprot:TRINITY_DN24512_c0_g1_i7.p1 TRINITY_DN24512_c0_g1~~TRINITY_DN24512_c0_g1_i7.p1  ORF type:complete len:427 (-),score=39.89 TRINITY_DN24512_c0_g1_i7:22-1302(-)